MQVFVASSVPVVVPGLDVHGAIGARGSDGSTRQNVLKSCLKPTVPLTGSVIVAESGDDLTARAQDTLEAPRSGLRNSKATWPLRVRLW